MRDPIREPIFDDNDYDDIKIFIVCSKTDTVPKQKKTRRLTRRCFVELEIFRPQGGCE